MTDFGSVRRTERAITFLADSDDGNNDNDDGNNDNDVVDKDALFVEAIFWSIVGAKNSLKQIFRREIRRILHGFGADGRWVTSWP